MARGSSCLFVVLAVSSLVFSSHAVPEPTSTFQAVVDSVLSVGESFTTRTLAQVNDGQEGSIFQVHAGGAAQAGPFLRDVMGTLQSQARAPIQASYREIGTVLAQSEFLNYDISVTNLNNFKVGDIPLSDASYQQFKALNKGNMMHIPLGVGSVSIFYNQQVPSFALQLSACLLARVYTGTITTWNDPDLSNFNNYGNSSATTGAEVAASLPYLNKDMVVFGYSVDNSAALIFSTYMNNLCANPPLGTTVPPAALKPAFSTRVTTTFNQQDITTPEQMATAIAATPGSIGFLPTNIGVQAGLNEARVQNVFGANVLVSQNEGISGEPTTADLQNTVQNTLSSKDRNKIPALPTDNWSQVDFSMADSIDAFPMTTLIYAYVYQDMSPFKSSGALTKALFQYAFTQVGQQMLTNSGLTALPPTLFAQAKASIDSFTIAATSTPWSFETATNPTEKGMLLQTFSALRSSALQASLDNLEQNVTDLWDRVESGLVVRGAGSAFGGAGYVVRSMMDTLSDYASSPVRFLFEEVNIGVDQLYNLLGPNAGEVKTRMLIMDQPLTGPQWADIGKQGVQVLQLPLMIRPISLLYSTGTNSSVPGSDTIPPLKISPCTLAHILRAEITTWNDPAILADNPNVDLPANTIMVYSPCKDQPCGIMKAIIEYVQAECSTVPIVDITSVTVAVNTSAYGDALANIVANERSAPNANNSYTILAFSTAGWAQQYSSFGLLEAQIPAVGGNPGDPVVWQTPVQSSASSMSDLLLSRMGPDSESWWMPWVNWEGFSLAGYRPTLGNPVVYPLARVDFLIVPADLNDMGDAGGALKGLLDYATSAWQTTSSFEQLYPDVAPLPDEVAEWANSLFATNVRKTADSADWPVIGSSRSAQPGDHPFITSYVPSASTGALQFATTTLNQLKVAQLAAATASLAVQQALLAQNKVNDANTMTQTSYALAIAALVLALIIALSGLVVAIFALKDAKKALWTVKTQAMYAGQNGGATPSYPQVVLSPARSQRHGASPLYGCLPGMMNKYEVYDKEGKDGESVTLEMAPGPNGLTNPAFRAGSGRNGITPQTSMLGNRTQSSSGPLSPSNKA